MQSFSARSLTVLGQYAPVLIWAFAMAFLHASVCLSSCYVVSMVGDLSPIIYRVSDVRCSLAAHFLEAVGSLSLFVPNDHYGSK